MLILLIENEGSTYLIEAQNTLFSPIRYCACKCRGYMWYTFIDLTLPECNKPETSSTQSLSREFLCHIKPGFWRGKSKWYRLISFLMCVSAKAAALEELIESAGAK